ncbi:MAG: leucine-rich repeat domain-containing protein, partial [Ruminococcus flavefaciens]|nr:leucine-rich repeat domain-containing protein [Ruminococcus flavefaciens]
VESITIPKNVEDIYPNSYGNSAWIYDLKEINVDSENKRYYSQDGVLYSRYEYIDESTPISSLVIYPPKKEGKEFTIPEGIKEIYHNAFFNCKNLENIIIPEGVEYIGTWAFEYCRNLSNISLPNSLEGIGDDAFVGCESLKNITIPESVTHIGKKAFGYMNDYWDDDELIPDFTITGKTNSEAERYAKKNNITFISNGEVSPWRYEVINKKNKTIRITKYYGSETELDIPSSIDGKTVVSIGQSAFYDCNNLLSVTIPDGVTEIGSYAFLFCESLKSVTIPNSLISIGEKAFCGCESLKNITIPESVTEIDRGALGYKYFDADEGGGELIPDFTITGKTNSEAERYAKKNNIKFISNGEVSPWQYEIWYKDEDYIAIRIIGYRGSETDLEIPSKIDGKTVVNIGYRAFDNCDDLISVTIPDTVTSIGDYAFRYCSSLESITIPNGIYSIGDEAFEGCESLKNVTIPESVTSIGDGAFGYKYYDYWDGSDWENGLIPDFTITGKTNSEAEAYAKRNNITFISNGEISPWKYEICDDEANTIRIIGYRGSETDLEIPSKIDGKSVAVIANSSFEGCEYLKSVIIPETVFSIEDYAFRYCISLESVVIPNSVSLIGNYAFSYCFSLENIVIPNSVKSIGDEAFLDCPLKSVTIPESVNFIGYRAFGFRNEHNEETWEWEYILVDDFTIIGKANSDAEGYAKRNNITFISNGEVSPWRYNVIDEKAKTIEVTGYYDKTVSELVIPSEIDGKKVVSIGSYAFDWDYEKLENIVIPDTVLTIWNNAFDGAPLKNVMIGKNVTSIGDYAFGWCDFTDVEIPDSVTNMGRYVFIDCNSLRNVKLSNTLTSISAGIFDRCDSLETIEIPDSVIAIGDYAFSGCTSLKNIKLPDSLTMLGQNAFGNCTSLESITIPNGVMLLDYNAFADCTALKEITLPSHLDGIGTDAFENCTSLAEITIPKSVTYIGNGAFYGCSALKDVNYEGTKEDWAKIDIVEEENEYLLNATIHFQEAPHVHSYTSAVTKEATCAAEGERTYTCSCGDSYKETIAKLPHTEETVLGKAATCTESGLTDGKKCSVCGEILEEQKEIAKLPHTEEIVLGKAATCTESGLTDGKKCSVCGEILEEQKEIAKLPHSEEPVLGKAATCTESGLTDGK